MFRARTDTSESSRRTSGRIKRLLMMQNKNGAPGQVGRTACQLESAVWAPIRIPGKRWPIGVLGCLAVLGAPQLAGAQDASTGDAPASAAEPGANQTDRTQELAEKLAKQESEIEALKAELKAELERRVSEERAQREAADAKLSSEAKADLQAGLAAWPAVAGSEGLTLSGFLQADMYVRQSSEDQLNSSTGAPLNDNRFAIKRARLRASIDRRYLAAIMEVDANTNNGPQARPMNMEATAKLPGDDVPYVAGSVGIFKIPYGYEIGQKDYERLFAERSNLERALFPGEYDLGARLAGGWRYVRYALAVQNGEPLGESTFPGRDPNGAKDVVGRLGAVASLGGGVDIQGGFSGLYGKGLHKGTAPTKPTVTWNDINEDGRIQTNSELIPVVGSSALPSMDFARHAIGLDLLVSAAIPKLGTTTAYGEVT